MRGAHDVPTLSEQDGIRYLHLGTEWIQGAMRVRKPSELVLAYTQQMMAWLMFVSAGRRDAVGILGLGAGSLLRYVLRHTEAQVDTVEWNPAVTALCRAYFRLPGPGRSHIEHMDAALWVEQPERYGRYAALMVDLYDAQAQGPVRDSKAFYRACRRTLAEGGIMTVNLFGNHDSYPRNLENIDAAFQGRWLALPEVDEGNQVVLAFEGPLPAVTTAQLLQQAEMVQARYGLPAVPWARHMLTNLVQGRRQP